MQRSRILYFNHDNPRPSGGMRTLYTHVRLLVKAGFNAFIVHGNPGFRPAWFAEPVPTLYWQPQLNLLPDDIVIVPEDLAGILSNLVNVNVRKLIFCQNHYYTFLALPRDRTWRDLGVNGVFASSHMIAEFIQTQLKWPQVQVVHYSIDHQLFKPATKKLQIACMPRKRAIEQSFIQGAFASLGEPWSKVPWVAIDQASEQRAAEALGESAIFLSLSHLEGFGLPPVEAMACQCAVVGYHGFGGREYATAENGFWCDDENPMTCVSKLRQVVDMILGHDPHIEQTLSAGVTTAAAYTRQRQQTELTQFMHTLLQ